MDYAFLCIKKIFIIRMMTLYCQLCIFLLSCIRAEFSFNTEMSYNQ